MGRRRAAGLGRALTRGWSRGRGLGARAGAAGTWGGGRGVERPQLHTSELNDGYNWGRLNLQSVTEQSTLDEFLATAELAGTEFVAEKLNVTIISAEDRTGLLTTEESKKIKKLHEENKQFLCIPRRPHWDENTAAEELQLAERETFLEWRRQLAQLEEERKLILTPFERNLDFWRQLWRVIERSDIVVQIVDARNPLLFRCEDMERYVKEVRPDKVNMMLLNKADLLSRAQRRLWASYFAAQGVRVLFWSATAEANRLDAEAKGEEQRGERSEESAGESDASDTAQRDVRPTDLTDEGESSQYEDCEDDELWETCSEDEKESITPCAVAAAGLEGAEINPPSCVDNDRTAPASSSNPTFPKQSVKNSSRLLQRSELLEIFKTSHKGKRVKDMEITVGLVGYPNVGKSSTINTIFQNKKVSVSATPGHTKHFQTLYVETGLCLCDCPGLVMPSFVSTKAEMVCCGILPVDQMRDHVPPASLHIPRHVLEATYGINIIRPREDEDPNRHPTCEELLTAYGYMRGFMTAHGQPDQPRAARYILKDYVTGKLLYCHPPPGVDSTQFQYHYAKSEDQVVTCDRNSTKLKGKQNKVKRIENDVDKNFFHQDNVRALTKGAQAAMGVRLGTEAMPADGGPGKPWKKHGNRNKKEKTRRICKHLDQ